MRVRATAGAVSDNCGMKIEARGACGRCAFATLLTTLAFLFSALASVKIAADDIDRSYLRNDGSQLPHEEKETRNRRHPRCRTTTPITSAAPSSNPDPAALSGRRNL